MSTTLLLRFRCALLLVTLARVVMQNAHGQYFFPGGEDYAHYDPNTPGTPNGRLYVGDKTGKSLCHYRIDVKVGKTVQKEYASYLVDIDEETGEEFQGPLAVFFTDGTGQWRYYLQSRFDLVDKDGKPCKPGLKARSAAQATGVGTINISNDADSFDLTCDGRYAVVVGANSPTPVSLVDLAAGAEVDKFAAESNATYATTFDDGESVVVILNIPPANDSNRLRRLKVVGGKLVDTGESLAAGPAGTIRRFKKVFAVPGSKVGVALAEFGAPGLVTFRIPGLQLLDSHPSAAGDSAAVSCAGDKVYVRNYSLRDGGQINGYTLDPVTGALGATPFLTISVGQTDTFETNFGNALAVSRDGTLLIVSEGTAYPNSPPTPRVTFFDTTTGERVGFDDTFDGGSPTLVSTYSCCAGPGLRLGIQQLPSGLIQITSTGGTGQKYELQKSQNLVAWDTLLEIQETESPAPYTDSDFKTNSTRFYRLKLVP